MCGIVALVGSQEAAPPLLSRHRHGERGAAAELPAGKAKLVTLTQRFEASGASGHCGISLPLPQHDRAITCMQGASKMHAGVASGLWPPFKSATCLIRCITSCSCGHDDLTAV
jgi:hypothetical protein